MKTVLRTLVFLPLAAIIGLVTGPAWGQSINLTPPFNANVLVQGLEAPWDMIWGPDGSIWVTEREGKRITAVNPETGQTKKLITLSDVKTGPQHEGILGMALDPHTQDGNTYLYVGHTYMDGNSEHARIVRLTYDAANNSLGNPHPVISSLPAGTDHNGGRLHIGPDNKIYYSIGEQGHNFGEHYCLPNEAQRLPTAEEIANQNYAAYPGKVLRLNKDGSIPEDNPVLNGVRSHIFTYGHRNPQGLLFVGNTLFSSEQGPSTDDEINILVSGGNYGWPHVAGYQDDKSYVYGNWSAVENCANVPFNPDSIPDVVPQQKESQWHGDNFQPPIQTLFTVGDDYPFDQVRCTEETAYMCNPTVSPGSIAHYPADGPIPFLRNSLLVTSMKHGVLYVLSLNKDGKTVNGTIIRHLQTPNRYRMVLLSPDNNTIYIATDVRGNIIGADGLATNNLQHTGAILKFEYTGSPQ